MVIWGVMFVAEWWAFRVMRLEAAGFGSGGTALLGFLDFRIRRRGVGAVVWLRVRGLERMV